MGKNFAMRLIQINDNLASVADCFCCFLFTHKDFSILSSSSVKEILKKLAMWKWKATHRQFFVTMRIAALKKNLCYAVA